MDRQAELEDLKKGEPYLRSGLAFLIYLVRAKNIRTEPEETMIDASYRVADIFLSRLKEDVNAS